MKSGIVLYVSFCLRLHFRRKDAMNHALWTQDGLLLKLLHGVAVARQYGLKVRLFASTVELVLEIPDDPILILIIPLQLLDLILQDEYDT